jgi:hypothetical protein
MVRKKRERLFLAEELPHPCRPVRVYARTPATITNQ